MHYHITFCINVYYFFTIYANIFSFMHISAVSVYIYAYLYVFLFRNAFLCRFFALPARFWGYSNTAATSLPSFTKAIKVSMGASQVSHCLPSMICLLLTFCQRPSGR